MGGAIKEEGVSVGYGDTLSEDPSHEDYLGTWQLEVHQAHSTVVHTNLPCHEGTDTGYKPFQCPYCQKAFAQKSHLANHERVHMGDRSFRCQTCQIVFTKKSNLMRHERVHTGERPLKCSLCGRAFRDLAERERHTKTHTGERPYPCEACGKRFARRDHLAKHQNKACTAHKPH